MATGVILAAGQSRRMGSPKQLLPLGGKAMLWHVAMAACQADFDEVLVITGAYSEQIRAAVRDLPLRIIHNEDWEQGQAASVKKAVLSLCSETQAVVFLLADQPLVDTQVINELLRVYDKTRASIIIPRFQNQPGNPVLFDVKVWKTSLLQLSGDEGARQIIRNNQERIQYIEVQEEKQFFDVDTPQEYRKMRKIWQVFRKNSRIKE